MPFWLVNPRLSSLAVKLALMLTVPPVRLALSTSLTVRPLSIACRPALSV